MVRPKWLRPRVGRNQRRKGASRPAAPRERVPSRPPTFREEMRQARLRQEAQRREEEERARKLLEEESLPTRQRIRRKKRKRQKGLRKGRVFFLLLVLALVIGGAVYVHQPWVAFGRLQVEGYTALTREEVEQMAGAPKPMNLFRLNWRGMLNAVRSDYRVSGAALGYGWPLTLKLYINDRQPALYVNFSGTTYGKLDLTGHVIGRGEGISDGSAPVLTGYGLGKNLSLGDATDDQDILDILGLLGKLDPSLRDRITEIHMDSSKNLKLYLSGGVPLIVGTCENAEQKLDTIAAICRELETKKIKAEYIDLTYEKPYVKVIE